MNNIKQLGEEFIKNPNFKNISKLMEKINLAIYGVNPCAFDSDHDCHSDHGEGGCEHWSHKNIPEK